MAQDGKRIFKMKIIIFTLSFLLIATLAFPQKETITSFQFTHFEEGEKSWDMKAEKGEIDKEKNEIYLKNFLVKFYEGSKAVSRLTAENGKIDEKNKQMEGKSNVRMESLRNKIKINTDEIKYSSEEKKIFSSSFVDLKRDGTLVKGEGLETTPNFDYIAIKKNASSFDPVKKYNISSDKMEIFQDKSIVEFKNRVKFTRENTVLTADFLHYDEKNQIAEAEGNGELVLESTGGEKTRINAEKITFYEKDEQIYAKGNVKIEQGENRALSNEALYYDQDERLVLTGGPPLVFQDEEDQKGEYQAEKVIFYLGEKRIYFEGDVKGTITYSEK